MTAALGVPPDEVASAVQSRAFTPNRMVGPSGAWAWATPNQAERQRNGLAPGLHLEVVEERPGGWLLVRSQAGWHGWTGEPYLIESASG